MASKRRERKKKVWTAHEIREVVQAIDDFLKVGDHDGIALVFDILGEEPPADIRRLPGHLRWLRAVLKLQLEPRENHDQQATQGPTAQDWQPLQKWPPAADFD